MKINKKSLKYVLDEIKKVKWKVVILAILNMVFALFAVLFALCLKEVVDAISIQDKDRIIYYALIFLTIILIQFILKIVISYFYEVYKSNLLKEKRQTLLKQILSKEYEDINKYHSGQLLNRVFTDVEILSESIINMIPELINLSTRLIVAITVLFILDWKFGLVFAASGLLLLVVAYLYRKKIKRAQKEVLKNEDALKSFYQENVSNSLIVKVFNNQKNILKKGDKLQDNYVHSRIRRRVASIEASSGFSLIFNLFYLGALVYGAFLIIDSNFTFGYGTLLALLEIIRQVSIPVAGLSNMLPQVYALTTSSERLIEIEQLPNEEEEEGLKEFNSLVFDKVSFKYKEANVLEDVSFKVNKNDYIAITGLSGGGKTTLFSLILGVYKKYQGSILVNDEDKPSVKTRTLFSYVPQGNTLFSGTIKENLTFLNEEITEEQIIEALRNSCSLDFVMSLENKLDTVIGEKGLGLSEGQAQRLALARCLLLDAPVLLLDEATSALDEQTEAEVLNNISKLNKTVLIVTHRKKALSYCNKILTIDDSKVKVEGK